MKNWILKLLTVTMICCLSLFCAQLPETHTEGAAEEYNPVSQVVLNIRAKIKRTRVYRRRYFKSHKTWTFDKWNQMLVLVSNRIARFYDSIIKSILALKRFKLLTIQLFSGAGIAL